MNYLKLPVEIGEILWCMHDGSIRSVKVKNLTTSFYIEKQSVNLTKGMIFTTDTILIMMPKSIFDTIDFSKLLIPKKLKFQPNLYTDEWIIMGVDDFKTERLEIKFDSNENYRLASFGH